MKIKRFLLGIITAISILGVSSCSESWKSLDEESSRQILDNAYYVTYRSDFELVSELKENGDSKSKIEYTHSYSKQFSATHFYSFENQKYNKDFSSYLEKKENSGFLLHTTDALGNKNVSFFPSGEKELNDYFPAGIKRENFKKPGIVGKRKGKECEIEILAANDTQMIFYIYDGQLQKIIKNYNTTNENYSFSYAIQDSKLSIPEKDKKTFNIKFVNFSETIHEKCVLAGDEIVFDGNENLLVAPDGTKSSGWSSELGFAYRDTTFYAIYDNYFPTCSVEFFVLKEGLYTSFSKQTVRVNSPIYLPTAPIYNGCQFHGWSKNQQSDAEDTIKTSTVLVQTDEQFFAKYDTNPSYLNIVVSWLSYGQEKTWTVWIPKNSSLKENGYYTIGGFTESLNQKLSSIIVNNNLRFNSLESFMSYKWTEDYGVNINCIMNLNEVPQDYCTVKFYHNGSLIETIMVAPDSNFNSQVNTVNSAIKKNYNQNVVAWKTQSNDFMVMSNSPIFTTSSDISYYSVCATNFGDSKVFTEVSKNRILSNEKLIADENEQINDISYNLNDFVSTFKKLPSDFKTKYKKVFDNYPSFRNHSAKAFQLSNNNSVSMVRIDNYIYNCSRTLEFVFQTEDIAAFQNFITVKINANFKLEEKIISVTDSLEKIESQDYINRNGVTVKRYIQDTYTLDKDSTTFTISWLDMNLYPQSTLFTRLTFKETTERIKSGTDLYTSLLKLGVTNITLNSALKPIITDEYCLETKNIPPAANEEAKTDTSGAVTLPLVSNSFGFIYKTSSKTISYQNSSSQDAQNYNFYKEIVRCATTENISLSSSTTLNRNDTVILTETAKSSERLFDVYYTGQKLGYPNKNSNSEYPYGKTYNAVISNGRGKISNELSFTQQVSFKEKMKVFSGETNPSFNFGTISEKWVVPIYDEDMSSAVFKDTTDNDNAILKYAEFIIESSRKCDEDTGEPSVEVISNHYSSFADILREHNSEISDWQPIPIKLDMRTYNCDYLLFQRTSAEIIGQGIGQKLYVTWNTEVWLVLRRKLSDSGGKSSFSDDLDLTIVHSDESQSYITVSPSAFYKQAIDGEYGKGELKSLETIAVGSTFVKDGYSYTCYCINVSKNGGDSVILDTLEFYDENGVRQVLSFNNLLIYSDDCKSTDDLPASGWNGNTPNGLTAHY